MALWIPEFLQTQKYSALRMRQSLLDSAVQAGAASSTDLAVSQRGAGATMSVDVAVGGAFVRGTTIARQGLYHVYSDAVANVAIGSNASGNPRVDQVVLRVYDSTDAAAGADQATIEVIAGTPTAGAQITSPAGASYRAGATTLPNDSIRLADVLVANGAASIVNANIQDRRPWARGFLGQVGGTTSGPTIPTTVGTVPELTMSYESSGAPLEISWRVAFNHTNTTTFVDTSPFIDGVSALGSAYGTVGGDVTQGVATGANMTTAAMGIFGSTIIKPSAGLHTISIGWSSGATGGTGYTTRRHMSIKELVR